MPLFAEAPWSTCPDTVMVPEKPPSAVCGSMFALEAALKPANPRVMALSTDGSRPRYAFFASSVEATPPPQATKAPRKLRAASATIGAERIGRECTDRFVPLSRMGNAHERGDDGGRATTPDPRISSWRQLLRGAVDLDGSAGIRTPSRRALTSRCAVAERTPD